jgi:hypothetical protein
MRFSSPKNNTVRLLGVLTAFMLANPTCASDKTDAAKTAQQEPQRNEATAAKSVAEPKSEVAVQASSGQTSESEKEQNIVDVYLFHGTYRCYSCNKMEELTLEAIDESLAEHKKNGSVRFKHVNVEEGANRHFIQDYRISAISIILSQKTADKEKQWKNLDQVWILLRNEDTFKEYVLNEIKAYL